LSIVISEAIATVRHDDCRNGLINALRLKTIYSLGFVSRLRHAEINEDKNKNIAT
jgi:hypothetical protein